MSAGPVPQPTLPVTLRIAGRRAVVVGGGQVAGRRALALVEAGADVVVVAPWAGPEVIEAAAAGRLEWRRRPYAPADLDGAWYVQTATGHPDVDAAVLADAEARRIWCAVGGDPAASAVWTPAVARWEDVLVAVNAGRDPRRARRIADGVAAALAAGDLPVRRVRREPAGVGSVALVGGGPGSDDLITVAGRRLLAEADVVVVDRLAPRGLLAGLDPEVVVVDVGKTSGHHPVPQEEINALLVEHALAGRRVVRLKGGDPYVFGRGSEELAACVAAGVPVTVIPGVTSAIAVPAAVGIPVTHRGLARGFVVVTAHEDVGDVGSDAGLTLVLLMGVGRLRETCETLVAAGRDPATPVAVIESGFTPGQRLTVGTLTTIAARADEVGVRSPAVTVVGDVVRLAPAWGAAGLR